MGKVVTVVDGKTSQVIFDANEGGLNVEVEECGRKFEASLDDHLDETVKLIVRFEGFLDPDEAELTLIEGEEPQSIFTLDGFSFRHLKG